MYFQMTANAFRISGGKCGATTMLRRAWVHKFATKVSQCARAPEARIKWMMSAMSMESSPPR
jgi:hypothetical protein